MHDFIREWKEFWLDLFRQVKNGAQVALGLLLVVVALGASIGAVIAIADWVSGRSKDCCPCDTEELARARAVIVQHEWLKHEERRRNAATPPADTAGALNDSSSVKDTAKAETGSKAP